MDVVAKVYLVFKNRWWPENVTGFNLLHSDEFPRQTSVQRVLCEINNLIFWLSNKCTGIKLELMKKNCAIN